MRDEMLIVVALAVVAVLVLVMGRARDERRWTDVDRTLDRCRDPKNPGKLLDTIECNQAAQMTALGCQVGGTIASGGKAPPPALCAKVGEIGVKVTNAALAGGQKLRDGGAKVVRAAGSAPSAITRAFGGLF